MTDILLKLFVKGDLANKQNRHKCGTLGSIVGIICNLILFIIKLIAGLLSGSLAIIADAFNNLTDMGSSVVTMLGFKLASKPADREHPFGHGRMEYMSAAFVSVLIIIVGFELFTESFTKLKNPTLTDTSFLTIVILSVSILIKLWMAFFNRKLGKKIDSAALVATATDSLNDCISTGTVLAISIFSMFGGHFSFTKYLDPVAGLAVAVFILIAGIKSLKETMDPIIGLPPEREDVLKIQDIVMSNEIFLGIHDMIVHNYGPGRSFVSLHVEVPTDIDILYCHELIDSTERKIQDETGFEAVIHMDPILVGDEFVDTTKAELIKRLNDLGEGFTIHDFRVVKGELQTNLIFDICVPADCGLSDSQVRETVSALAHDIDKTFQCVITVDRDFSSTNFSI
ncbi:MAG: cation transporter [Ruminococcaceae bacterium]|nr:cation transporter [Oscillospiraceae bacterium]